MGPITLNSEGSSMCVLGTNPFRMKNPHQGSPQPWVSALGWVWNSVSGKKTTTKKPMYTTLYASVKHWAKLGRHLSWRTIIYLQTAGVREQQYTAKDRRKRWSFTELWKEMVSPQAGNLCFFTVCVISLSQFPGRTFVYLDTAWCLHDTSFGCTAKHWHKITFQYPYIPVVYRQQNFRNE